MYKMLILKSNGQQPSELLAVGGSWRSARMHPPYKAVNGSVVCGCESHAPRHAEVPYGSANYRRAHPRAEAKEQGCLDPLSFWLKRPQKARSK